MYSVNNVSKGYINLVTLIILLILGIIEEFYLTCHPEERTTYIRTSIFQKCFIP